MFLLRRAVCCSLMFSFCLISAVHAQDQEAAESQQSALEKQLEEWDQLNSKLTEVETKFSLEPDVKKQTEYREEYLGLVDEAEVLVDDLRDSAMSEFKKDPTQKLAIKTLMGIALNDAQNDRESQVLELGDELIASDVNPQYFEVASKSIRLNIDQREIFEELIIRQRETKADDLPRVRITTGKGEIVLELFENEAPDTVGNFVSLVKKGYYDGLKFHRVMADFMAQTGDPNGDGSGGPGYNIFCECNSPESRNHFTGSLSMAKQTPVNTGGSQFFLTLKRTQMLDGKHTVFGRIISGMDVVQSLTKTATTDPVTGQDVPIPGAEPDVIEKAEIIRVRDHEYVPNKVPVEGEESNDAETSEGSGDNDQ